MTLALTQADRAFQQEVRDFIRDEFPADLKAKADAGRLRKGGERLPYGGERRGLRLRIGFAKGLRHGAHLADVGDRDLTRTSQMSMKMLLPEIMMIWMRGSLVAKTSSRPKSSGTHRWTTRLLPRSGPWSATAASWLLMIAWIWQSRRALR